MCVIFGYHVTVCIAPTYFHRNLGSLALTRPLYVTLHSVYFRSCCLKQFKWPLVFVTSVVHLWNIVFYSIWMKITNWVGVRWRLCFDSVLRNKDYIYLSCKKSHYRKLSSALLGLSRKRYSALIVVFINRSRLKLVISPKLNHNK